jgi:hypothetical protein
MKKEGNIKIDRSIDRPGVHAKTKTSKLKTSKNYVKKNIGQGR